MKRRPGFVAGGLVLLLAGGLVATLLFSRGASDRAAERRAVKAYVDAVRPAGVEGGRIVQQEIKPLLTDLRQGQVTPQQFRTEAEGWLRRFRVIRRTFAESPHPARLNQAASLYAEAMNGYVAAVQAWIVASAKPAQAARNAAIAEAASIAEEADDAYDRARAALEREMRRVGLRVPEL
ncbi:MAG: hypothetical protein ACRDJM_08705 [Actinomycetota bacterium]